MNQEPKPLHHEEELKFMQLCQMPQFNLHDLVTSDLMSHPDFLQRLELCMRLVTEEYEELRNAVEMIKDARNELWTVSPHKRAQMLSEILDGGIDLTYVVNQLLNTLSLPIQAAFEEVQRSNMAKAHMEGGKLIIHRRPDGKILKPEDWKAPDLAKIIREAASK